MKKSKFILLFLLTFTLNKAQQTKNIQAFYNYAFCQDSLKGFDEAAATKSAISEQFLAEELQVRMYQVKREYINAKYHLISQAHIATNTLATALSKTVSAPCLNSDFEASTAGILNYSNQISGWTVGRGMHNSGSVFGNSCDLVGYNNSPPAESALIVAPNGYVDQNIGSIYPIYSVFGSSAGDPNGEVANPQIAQGLFGDNIIRINSDQLGFYAYSIEKLSKSILVTNNNYFFQYAFITVFASGHSCCDAGAFQVRVYNTTTNNLISCSGFSASALSSACSNTNTGILFLNSQTGTPATISSSIIFNKWQINSIDLSQYIGQTILIEFIASDCTGGGHFGYTYIDAKCDSNTPYVNCNGQNYSSTTNTINIIGCNVPYNIKLQSGNNLYSWAGPNLPTGYTFPSSSNDNIQISNSGTYTLFVTPSSTCSSVSHSIITLSQAVSLQATTTDSLICNGSSSVLFVQGSQHYIHWSTGDTTNYIVVTPSITTTYSVYSKDIYGCSMTSYTTVYVQDCTSLNFQSSEENNYHIYPNPNNGEFMITSTKSSGVGDFVIENALGQMVFRQTLSMGDNPIKTKNLASGLYYYSIYHASVLV
ncbi:MAG: T9SS type A sorting domain-containing protein, partial [Bacteroidia bacterium]|nr:T9SS type A sorting domain-containing protein [Bacteroidia bacterium]